MANTGPREPGQSPRGVHATADRHARPRVQSAIFSRSYSRSRSRDSESRSLSPVPCPAAARYADKDDEEPDMEELVGEDQAQQLEADDGEKSEAASSAPSSPAPKRGRVGDGSGDEGRGIPEIPRLPHAIFDSRAFQNNELCETQEELDASLAVYLKLCKRHFCFIAWGKTPLVVELRYPRGRLVL